MSSDGQSRGNIGFGFKKALRRDEKSIAKKSCFRICRTKSALDDEAISS
jgi:hypothetical protein